MEYIMLGYSGCDAKHLLVFATYTECIRNLLIISFERHSWKSTASNVIISGKKIFFLHVSKRRKMQRKNNHWNHRKCLIKNHRIWSSHELTVHHTPRVVHDYITHLWSWVNVYWTFWIICLSFVFFFVKHSLISLYISPFWHGQPLDFFVDVLLKPGVLWLTVSKEYWFWCGGF